MRSHLLRVRPKLNSLEDRSVPATFTVSNADDAGAGSFRQALLDANANPGADNIAFAVGTGPVTINLLSALPTITGPTLILGNTQPGFTDPSNINPDQFFNAPFPFVTLNGSKAGVSVDGLHFDSGSDGSQIQYLQVLNFTGNGIVFDNSANGLVAYTVASGNGGNGVLISGANAKANRLENMFIGVDKTGNTVIANGGDGVLITDNASGNVVGGGNFFQARCIISGNVGNGLRITNGAFGNLEQGNVIGLNTGNSKALGNGLDGVLVEGTGAGNIIGGPIGLGGIKAGNGRHGVSIVGESPGTVVYNTFGGLSAFSNRSLGNGVDGIHVTASGAGIILTTNITSGNGRYGTYIGGNANGVVINTLLSGVGFPGVIAIPNAAGGVIVTDNAKNTQIGTLTVPQEIIDLFGSTAATPEELRNIFAGNEGPGLIIEGNAANTRVINTNFGAGTGVSPFPNSGPGIIVRGNATGTFIGALDPAGQNRVAYDPAGIVVQTPNPVTISRNTIFDVAGDAIDTSGQGVAAQTPPRLTAAQGTGGTLSVAGAAFGPANSKITVEIFASPEAGEAKEYLATVQVTTDANGIGRFQTVVNPETGNTYISATATGANGNTSELSNSLSAEQRPIIATGAGTGGGPQVNVVAADTQQLMFSFFAYDETFTGGVRVAVGDVNNDGINDIVTAPGAGGGPHIRVYDGASGLPLPGTIGSFYAYDANFTNGVFVAVGDVNGDGYGDVITGPDVGGGPNVKVFSGKDGSLLQSFFAFDQSFTGGVRVGAGDIDGEGTSDVIVGNGPGIAPLVRIFGHTPFGLITEFAPLDSTFTGGVYVAGGDLTGTGFDSIIVGAGKGGSLVQWFNGEGTKFGEFAPFGTDYTGGVRVSSIDAAGVGFESILVGAGPGGGPRIAGIIINTPENTGPELVGSNFAYDPSFLGGIFVGGA